VLTDQSGIGFGPPGLLAKLKVFTYEVLERNHEAMVWDQRRKVGAINNALFGWPFKVVRREEDNENLEEAWSFCRVQLQGSWDETTVPFNYKTHLAAGEYDQLFPSDFDIEALKQKEADQDAQHTMYADSGLPLSHYAYVMDWMAEAIAQEQAVTLGLHQARVTQNKGKWELWLVDIKGTRTVDEWVQCILSISDKLTVPRQGLQKITIDPMSIEDLSILCKLRGGRTDEAVGQLLAWYAGRQVGFVMHMQNLRGSPTMQDNLALRLQLTELHDLVESLL
jgi:hypothetical protein